MKSIVHSQRILSSRNVLKQTRVASNLRRFTSETKSSPKETIAKDFNRINFNSPLLADPEKKEIIDSMIRVNHAGEYGAQMIYAGQLAVLGNTPEGPIIQVSFRFSSYAK